MVFYEVIYWGGPVVGQIALTMALGLWMTLCQFGAIRNGHVKLEDVRVRGTANYPRYAQQAGDAFHNQFELPVLFYIVYYLAWLTGTIEQTAITLGWVFFVCRLAHAVIHITYNNVIHRFVAWLAGFVTLIGLLLVYLTGEFH